MGEDGLQLLPLGNLSLMSCLVVLNKNKKQFWTSKISNTRIVSNHVGVIILDRMDALSDLRCG